MDTNQTIRPFNVGADPVFGSRAAEIVLRMEGAAGLKVHGPERCR